MSRSRGGGVLDYTEASLLVVEEILAEAAEYELTANEVRMLSEDFGCYILEVGRRALGGVYYWHAREQPILVVGEPAFHLGIMSWGKVRGRLSGDAGDNIPFFFQGFARRARQATPGDHVIYV
jgi:hypothetical protein